MTPRRTACSRVRALRQPALLAPSRVSGDRFQPAPARAPDHVPRSGPDCQLNMHKKQQVTARTATPRRQNSNILVAPQALAYAARRAVGASSITPRSTVHTASTSGHQVPMGETLDAKLARAQCNVGLHAPHTTACHGTVSPPNRARPSTAPAIPPTPARLVSTIKHVLQSFQLPPVPRTPLPRMLSRYLHTSVFRNACNYLNPTQRSSKNEIVVGSRRLSPTSYGLRVIFHGQHPISRPYPHCLMNDRRSAYSSYRDSLLPCSWVQPPILPAARR